MSASSVVTGISVGELTRLGGIRLTAWLTLFGERGFPLTPLKESGKRVKPESSDLSRKDRLEVSTRRFRKSRRVGDPWIWALVLESGGRVDSVQVLSLQGNVGMVKPANLEEGRSEYPLRVILRQRVNAALYYTKPYKTRLIRKTRMEVVFVGRVSDERFSATGGYHVPCLFSSRSETVKERNETPTGL